MSPLHDVIINKDTKINPIWIMRQAGRYLPEFREIRSKNQDFIKLCLNENLSSEITVQPLRRFDLDGAILFADILLIPNALGQHLEFIEGKGPYLEPIKDFSDYKNLKEFNKIHDILNPVYDAVSNIKSKLEKQILEKDQ